MRTNWNKSSGAVGRLQQRWTLYVVPGQNQIGQIIRANKMIIFQTSGRRQATISCHHWIHHLKDKSYIIIFPWFNMRNFHSARQHFVSESLSFHFHFLSLGDKIAYWMFTIFLLRHVWSSRARSSDGEVPCLKFSKFWCNSQISLYYDRMSNNDGVEFDAFWFSSTGFFD